MTFLTPGSFLGDFFFGVGTAGGGLSYRHGFVVDGLVLFVVVVVVIDFFIVFSFIFVVLVFVVIICVVTRVMLSMSMVPLSTIRLHLPTDKTGEFEIPITFSKKK